MKTIEGAFPLVLREVEGLRCDTHGPTRWCCYQCMQAGLAKLGVAMWHDLPKKTEEPNP